MKVETAVELDRELLDILKDEARERPVSLSKLIEEILYREVRIPNEETQKAIEDAHNNRNLSVIEDLDEYLEELLNEED